jgi:hypothetical protein
MPVPILRDVSDEPVFAIHDEVPSTAHPRRNERHADGHVLDLLETAFPLVHKLAMHRREPNVEPLELLKLCIEPPRPRLHLHRVEGKVITGPNYVNLEVVAIGSKLS